MVQVGFQILIIAGVMFLEFLVFKCAINHFLTPNVTGCNSLINKSQVIVFSMTCFCPNFGFNFLFSEQSC